MPVSFTTIEKQTLSGRFVGAGASAISAAKLLAYPINAQKALIDDSLISPDPVSVTSGVDGSWSIDLIKRVQYMIVGQLPSGYEWFRKQVTITDDATALFGAYGGGSTTP